MMIRRRLPFEAFYMHKMTIVIVAGITLTAHATRPLLMQLIKIFFDDLAGQMLPALHDRERHNIP